MKTARRLLLGLGAALTPAFLVAQGIPLGSEFQVNTYTTGRQAHPGVAAWNGGFIVVWARGPGNPGIFAQTYDSQGRLTGSEFQVNTGTPVPGQYPAVAADASGGFIVVWQGASDGVTQGQRFDSSATRVGSQFALPGVFPRVAADAAGDFVVVLTEGSSDQYSPFLSLVGQRFDSSGASVGSQFVVANRTMEPGSSYYTTVTHYPERSAVTMSSAGDFVVAWDVGVHYFLMGGRPQTNPPTGIFGQRYHRSGVKLGTTFLVAGDTEAVPSIAEDKPGNFVVVWSSGGYIVGERFDAAGAPVGPEFNVNTYATGAKTSPSVAVDEAGNFLVVWGSESQDGSSSGVFGALFDRHGKRIGDEFPINSYTTGTQDQPWVASGGGDFVAAWESADQDGSGLGVFGRRQNLVPETLAADAEPATGTASDHNGVLEPGETILVEPQWKNVSDASVGVTGAAFILPCAPGTACVTPVNTSAVYGTIAAGASANCNKIGPGCLLSRVGERPPSGHPLGRRIRRDPFRRRRPLLDYARGRQLLGRAAVAALLQEDRDAPSQRHHGGLHGHDVLPRRDGGARRDGDLHRAAPSPATGSSCPRRPSRARSTTAPPAAIRTSPTSPRPIPSASTSTISPPSTYSSAATQRSTAPARPSPGTPWPLSSREPSSRREAEPPSRSATPIRRPRGRIPAQRAARSSTSPTCPSRTLSASTSTISGRRGSWPAARPTDLLSRRPVARDAMAKFIANGFGLQLYGP